MSENNTQPATPAPAVGSIEDLFNKTKLLLEKLVAVEQDPDLISVFSIARAHGYKTTSRFWHDEAAAVAVSLKAYHEATQKDKVIDVAFDKALDEAKQVVEEKK